VSNPFIIDPTSGHLRPLQPWRVDRDQLFYVPVDHTEEQFTLFKRSLAQPHSLVDQGRLVLVTGNGGCGKTSLVNRCAKWVRDQLVTAGVNGAIIDLTQETKLTEPADTRMRKVFFRLVDELGQAMLIGASARDTMLAVEVDRGYPILSRSLAATSTVAIVLLPPSGELADEVEMYAGLARQRILFFAESSYAQKMTWLRESSGRTASAIHLKVGPIGRSDCWDFVSNRLQLCDAGNAPKITRATVRRMANNLKGMNIRSVEKILHGVFERAIARSRSTITYSDIGDYLLHELSEISNEDGWRR